MFFFFSVLGEQGSTDINQFRDLPKDAAVGDVLSLPTPSY